MKLAHNPAAIDLTQQGGHHILEEKIPTISSLLISQQALPAKIMFCNDFKVYHSASNIQMESKSLRLILV